MTADFTIITKSPEETVNFGKQLSEKIKDKDIVALYGDLGSGKTQLVKGICLGLGVKDIVNSPTFLIVNEYSSPSFIIFHFDLYRIHSEAEVLNIGFDDYMARRGIILIEWPEHIERLLPEKIIKVHIAHTNENQSHRFIKLSMSRHDQEVK